MQSDSFLCEQDGAVWLAVKVQPRSSRNAVGDVLGNELKIRVTAPPVDSAANEALIKFLAEELDCARNQIELVRGHASRHKMVKLHGIPMAQIQARLRRPA